MKTTTTLRNLYGIRTAFSVIWVILLLKTDLTTFLLIIYPIWDVIGTIIDLRADTESPKAPRYLNGLISIITAIAVVFALKQGVPKTFMVFGAWAILTGAIQLTLGIRRRKLMEGQWPMIISGGQSMLGGTSFILLAHDPTKGLTSLGGYAAFGAFYYLLAAYRLSRKNDVVKQVASN